MTRAEFMDYAEREIEAIIIQQKNRLMNLVARAWAEGKRNAEIDALTATVKAALEQMEKKEQQSVDEREESVDEREDPCKNCQEFVCNDCKIWIEKYKGGGRA